MALLHLLLLLPLPLLPLLLLLSILCCRGACSCRIVKVFAALPNDDVCAIVTIIARCRASSLSLLKVWVTRGHSMFEVEWVLVVLQRRVDKLVGYSVGGRSIETCVAPFVYPRRFMVSFQHGVHCGADECSLFHLSFLMLCASF